MSSTKVSESLGKNVWECMKCRMPNFSTSLFDTTASLETHNIFDSYLHCPTLKVQYQLSPPNAASFPIVQEPKEAKGKATKAALNHPLRILVMNFQSIKNKKTELYTIIDSAKPDIILANESWLTPDIKNSESVPDSFNAVQKDRASDAQCRVFIAFKRDLLCTETPELDTSCEIVWCKLNSIDVGHYTLVLFIAPLIRLLMIILRSLIHPYIGYCLIEMYIFWSEEILIAVI